MEEYRVGQILYMTNDKKMNIIPVKIIEEIIRTTLNGKEKMYMVMFPDSKKTTCMMHQLKGKLFDSIDEVKKYMLNNATIAINKMAQSAIQIQKEVFINEIEENDNIDYQKENSVQADVNDDIITVDLGNGVKAKMNTSILDKVAQ